MTNEDQAKSDERIRQLNERCAENQAEVTQLKKETEKIKHETELIRQETEKIQRENAKGFEEIRQMQKENAEQQKANAEQQKANAEQQKKTDKQIGGLGNKFGGYTEAMARPAIRRILEERFHAHYLGPVRFKSTNEVGAVEVDAWGLSRNGTGTAYLVEIKSKFRDEHIEQVWKQVERFRIHYSAIWEQPVYPMLAVVDISEEGREKVWDAGIHLIEIDDGVFQYAKPPKDFEADGYHGMHGVRKDVPHLRAVPG